MLKVKSLTFEETLEWMRSLVSGESCSFVEDSERQNYVMILALMESGSLDNHGNRFICIENGVLFGASCEEPGDFFTLIPESTSNSTIFHVPLDEDIDKETYAVPGEVILGRRRRKHKNSEYWSK